MHIKIYFDSVRFIKIYKQFDYRLGYPKDKRIGHLLSAFYRL